MERLWQPELRARNERGRCHVKGSSFDPGTEDHTALQLDPSHWRRLTWQVPDKGEGPDTAAWDPGFLNSYPPICPTAPKTVCRGEGVCFLWIPEDPSLRMRSANLDPQRAFWKVVLI